MKKSFSNSQLVGSYSGVKTRYTGRTSLAEPMIKITLKSPCHLMLPFSCPAAFSPAPLRPPRFAPIRVEDPQPKQRLSSGSHAAPPPSLLLFAAPLHSLLLLAALSHCHQPSKAQSRASSCLRPYALTPCSPYSSLPPVPAPCYLGSSTAVISGHFDMWLGHPQLINK